MHVVQAMYYHALNEIFIRSSQTRVHVVLRKTKVSRPSKQLPSVAAAHLAPAAKSRGSIQDSLWVGLLL